MSAGAIPALYRLVNTTPPQLDDFDSWMVRRLRKPKRVERDEPGKWAGRIVRLAGSGDADSGDIERVLA
jgi:hypothetical protein